MEIATSDRQTGNYKNNPTSYSYLLGHGDAVTAAKSSTFPRETIVKILDLEVGSIAGQHRSPYSSITFLNNIPSFRGLCQNIMTTVVSLPTSCSYQLNPPYSSWSLLSPGEAEGGKGGGNVVKPMTEQSRPERAGHVPEAYVRSDGRPAAACGRRGRISSRAPRCWTGGAG